MRNWFFPWKASSVAGLLSALTLCAAAAVHARLAPPDAGRPAGGAPVLAGDLFAARLAGREAGKASLATVTVEAGAGVPFDRALRLTTSGRTRGEDAVMLVWDNARPIDGQDTLFLRFWARVVETEDETGEARIRIALKRREGTPDAVFFPKQAAARARWGRVDIPISLRTGEPKVGGAEFQLQLGNQGRQTVEIAGLTLLDYGPNVRASDLPHKKDTYAGREPDAPWRKAAAARIEKHRKGDLTVHVVGADGKPLFGATVRVAMTRHAYHFGTGAYEGPFNPDIQTPTARKYRETSRELFNYVIIGRGLLWEFWGKPDTRPATFKSVGWLNDNGFVVHGGGHVLWPNWRHTPAGLKRGYEERLARDGADAAREWLRQTCREHVRDIVSAGRGKVRAWNVVNETRGNKDLLNILGRDEMVEWFRTARAADPGARLFINENAIERPGTQADLYEKEIRFLLGKGAPLDAIGIQGHVGAAAITEMEASLDRFARLGLPIEITEFDLVTPDDAIQGDFTRDYLTLAFSHPATTGFSMWGFWDGAHWLNDAPIYYKDWTLKPSGEAYRDLVLNEWWTRADGATGKDGAYRTRGFLGDYEVTVTHGGKTVTRKASLPRAGATLEVRL